MILTTVILGMEEFVMIACAPSGFHLYVFGWLPLICIFGGWILLMLGARFLARLKRVGVGRCFGVAALATLICYASVTLGGIIEEAAKANDTMIVAGHLLAGILGVGACWLIAKKLLRTTYRQAILASLPMLALLGGLFAPLMLNDSHSYKSKQRAWAKMSSTKLYGLGKAVRMYAAENDSQYPPILKDLIEAGWLSETMLHYPSDKSIRYFYHCPAKDAPGSTLVACEPRIVYGNRRSLVMLDGSVTLMNEEQFAGALTWPENKAFAEAYYKAHGKPATSTKAIEN